MKICTNPFNKNLIDKFNVFLYMCPNIRLLQYYIWTPNHLCFIPV